MKSGQLFWGFFFLSLGGLFFLTKYDVIVSDFNFVWDIWPFIFVLWGLAVITKNSIGRPTVSALFGIFTGLMLFGFLYNLFGSFEINNDYHGYVSERYSEEYDPSIKEATFELDTGAGVVSINNTSENLVSGYSRGSLAEYDMLLSRDDSTAKVKMFLHKKRFNFFRDKFRNYLELSLNPNPVWDVELNMGAAKGKFDLSEYKVKNLELHTGASNVRIKLGDLVDESNVTIEMGAASITLDIPENVGCKITGDMVLSGKDINGFIKNSSNHYETDNYYSANKTINVRIDGGVSSITVNRY